MGQKIRGKAASRRHTKPHTHKSTATQTVTKTSLN